MTVLATDNSKLFDGSGNTGPFTWTWRFLRNGDIRVTKIVGGITTLLVEDVDYELSGAGTYAGGSLTLTAVLAELEQLYVERNTAITQGVDLRTQLDFLPEIYEDALDFLCMMIQDQQREIDAAPAAAAAAAAAAAVGGALAGVGMFYVESAANGPIVLPASGNVRVAKAIGDESADALNIVPSVLGQTIEGNEQYRDGLTGAGESVFLVFNETDNTWYKF